MIIRCERCSTLYDLDETLLAPGGSPVQCTKCQAVFNAVPPKPGEAAPPAAPPASAAQASSPVEPASPVVEPAAPKRPPPASNVYRRPQPPAKPAAPARGRARTGAPPRDAVSAMDARLRMVGRWKLAAIPVAAIILAAVGYAGWSAWKRLPSGESQRQRAEASALISLDDAGSLAHAIELLDGIQSGDHATRGAAGERGLARALLVAANTEELEPAVDRLAAAAAEKARLEREQPPGAEDGLRALTVEMARVEAELAPRRQKLEAQRTLAAGELQALAGMTRGAIEAARGQAVLAALDGNAEEVQRTAGLLRAAGPDPWADLAELWLAVRKDGASRDQAIPRLTALAGAHPHLIRARFVLARALLAAGRREEAISSLGLLLAANPHHERAQRLRAQLATPPPAPVQPPTPLAAPARPAWAPRAAVPPAAATNTPVAPAATPVAPPQAAPNQLATPAPLPAAPAAPPPAATPAPPEPAPAPLPKPKPRPPEPSGTFDPTAG